MHRTQSVKRSGLALVAVTLLFGITTFAQVPGEARDRRAARGRARTTQAGKDARRQQPSAQPAATPAPVALVNKVEPDYLSGEANVSVRGNQNPIIRVGLAQNGVTIVEFPASDKIYYLHPGNSDLVTVDEMKNRETDLPENRFLVFRAGAGFVAPSGSSSSSRGPSASIMVQMDSGMVITLMIYPVRELAHNAHRVVVMYNRDEVIAARRAAGLPTNLDGVEQPGSAKPAAVSVKIASPNARAADSADQAGVAPGGPAVVPTPAPVVSDVDTAEADKRAARGKSKKRESKPAEAANKALVVAVKQPAKFTKWSPAAHGLSVAVAPAVDVDLQTRMVVVAVRNESQAAVRVVPGNPEIFVQTFDDGGRPIQIEQIKRLHVETTSLGGQLAPGQVAYYAIIYEAPILGARQRLRVSVAQTEAADEPASADLRAQSR